MNKRIPFHAAVTAALALQVMGLVPGVMRQCRADEMQVAPIALKAHTWLPLGGQFKLGVSAVAGASNSIVVNGVGSDGARWSIESGDGGKTWGSPESHNGTLLSAPACDIDSNDAKKVSCFWVSGNGFLWGQMSNGEFVGALSGMTATSAPSVFSFYQPGRIYLFAHGANDDALWFARTDDGKVTGAWTSMGGQLKGQASCLQTGEHHVGGVFNGAVVPDFSCFVLGSDGVVWAEHEHQVPSSIKGFTETQYVWESIGGEALDGVNAFKSEAGAAGIRLAVRGTDSALWIAHQELRDDQDNPVFGGGYEKISEWKWQRFPGEIASVPSCSLTYCFAILPDGQMGFLDLTGRL